MLPMSRRWGTRALTVLALTASSLVVGGVSTSVSAAELSKTFSTVGASTWTVPAGVNEVQIEAIGGAGGKNRPSGSEAPLPGGRAAEVAATISVAPGQVLNIHVGGNGADGANFGQGGENGGSTPRFWAGGSGGATDVRTGGDALSHRILVAAGGSGSLLNIVGSDAHAAGSGIQLGWPTPCAVNRATPGSASAGGAGGTATGCGYGNAPKAGGAGTAGAGGAGGADFQWESTPYEGGGAGAGGYFGGGGGSSLGTGAGGSSLVPSGSRNQSIGLAGAGSTPQVTLTWLTQVRSLNFSGGTSVPADGQSTSTITFTPRDRNDATVSGVVPTATTDLGTLSAVTSLGNGSFSVTLTAPAVSGTASVEVTAGGHAETREVTITKRVQTATLNLAATADAVVDQTWTVSGQASSELPVTLTVAGACTLSGDAVTFIVGGTCIITGTQLGNGTWAPASATSTVTVVRLGQTIEFAPSTGGRVGTSIDLAAVGGASGEPVVFSAVGLGCRIEGEALELIAVKPCVVRADQAGNARFNAAQRVEHAITVNKGAQSLSFSTPATGLVNDTVNLTATAGPSGSPVTFRVDDSSDAGVCEVDGSTVELRAAGSCVVVAEQIGTDDYEPAESVTSSIEVSRRAQEISFTAPAAGRVGTSVPLVATGGASGLPVTFSATGAGCSVSGTSLNLLAVADCTVTAHQDGTVAYAPATDVDRSYTALPGEQTITFVAPASGLVGDDITLSAVGGPSGEPVTFGVAGSSAAGACEATGTTLQLTGEGECVVVAKQAATTDYDAAPPVQASVQVSRRPTSVALTAVPSIVFGQDAPVTATVTGATAGAVQFEVEGVWGSPITLSGGAATASLKGLTVGSHEVRARFVPTDAVTYQPSSSTLGSVVVAKADTAGEVKLTSSTISYRATPVAPGGGVPTGTVTFSVGGSVVGMANLSGGVATLRHAVSTAHVLSVSATYDGDVNFLASSASTVRSNPKITAKVSGRPNNAGWHRAPVTVSFTCVAGSDALAGPCPPPVTLKDGAALSVTRTISARDGGVATASVSGINVDTRAPKVRLSGVKSGKTYSSTPKAKCVASDAGSGVASCRVTKSVKGLKTKYVATAFDRAGNRSRSSASVTISKATLQGAILRSGSYQVRTGRTYTLVVTSKERPRYLVATKAPGKPRVAGARLYKVGKDRWAIGVIFDSAMRHTKNWRIGVKVGKRTEVLRIRVLR